MKALYTTIATAHGGREGQAGTSDGRLSVKLSIPKELGGPGAAGATNPEQLFAAGYAACFESAIRHVARGQKLSLQDVSVTSQVSLHTAPTGFALSARLEADIAGLDAAAALALVQEAHRICPYSNATRGNISVEVGLKPAS